MVYAMTCRRLTWPLTIFSACSIALAFAWGCTRSPPASAAPVLLDVEVVGCGAVRRAKIGIVCELPESRVVRLILPPGANSPKVSVGDTLRAAPVDAAVLVRDREGGLVTVDVPKDATQIVVDAVVSGRPARRAVHVATAEKLPWLEDARAARAKGDLDRAQLLATSHASDATTTTTAKALATGLLARIALARGRADEAFPLFRAAIELHRGAERISDAIDDSFALAFALHQRSQRYTEARAVLDAIGPSLADYAEGRARDPYYRGSLAAETGDRRRALALLREAARAARRLGMTRLERNARSALALELQEIGRAKASLPLLAALEAELDEAARSGKDAPSACERVEVANNRGWGALLVNEAAASEGEPRTEDARGALERALAIEGCADAYVRGFALANLARLALAENDLGTAEKGLAAARSGVEEPRGTERLAWLDLEGRLLLAHGRARDALRVFDEALTMARAAVLRLQEWSLLVSRADALVALKRAPEAIAALEAAEDVLDDAALLVPLGEGRGAFVDGRSRSARALVGLLVKSGRAIDAAAVAERAQARVLASVERALRLEQLAPPERARWEEAVRRFRSARAAIDADAAGDWRLPTDSLARAAAARTDRERELRRALEGALTVLGRPTAKLEPRKHTPGTIEIDVGLDLEGFVAIAKHDRGVSAHRLPSPRSSSLAELSRALLDPLVERFERPGPTAMLVVRTYGAWRTVDIHALPWRGEPLLAQIPIAHSIGLGGRGDPGAPDATATARGTLVVGDPTSDLPAALEEARSVVRALEARPRTGADTVRLLVGDQATSAAVSEAIRGMDRFHYAGHGVFAGEEGWESELPLAAGGRLTAPGILTLAPAPRSVVLTGCEAARSAGEAEGLGLAQAFVAAGAREVLAPVRRVPDTLARKLAAALYSEQAAGAPLVRVARSALLAVRREDPASDWAAFRVLVP